MRREQSVLRNLLLGGVLSLVFGFASFLVSQFIVPIDIAPEATNALFISIGVCSLSGGVGGALGSRFGKRFWF